MSKKVALVTGAGARRVGSHVADALAERGFTLAIHYRNSAKEAEAAVADYAARGIEAAAFRADLSDEASVGEMVRAVVARFGRIDVLVNTAAAWRSQRLEDVTAADVRAHFETNTLGTFLCCRQVGLQMVDQPEGGSIVTFGDWACERPYLNYSSYFPSKGAIPTITRCLAHELAHRNPKIRVNCILPGPVMLPPDLPQEERDEAIDATLLKREGNPRNVAQAVLFFVDNDFVTGTCLPVDGGRTIYAKGI